MKNKILLHACCAPCSAYVCELLNSENFEPIIYFYNPNIYPLEEYTRRLAELRRFCELKNYSLIEEIADFESWENSVKGLEHEPEKGKRCEICYSLRLKKTAQKAQELGINLISTTLSISPHKSYPIIKKYGELWAKEFGAEFLDRDFKKKDGFKKSTELSRQYNFYRQDYCGCKYSIRTV